VIAALVAVGVVLVPIGVVGYLLIALEELKKIG
jgi:hypothetical protein